MVYVRKGENHEYPKTVAADIYRNTTSLFTQWIR